ncbi:hypothetical protein ACIPJM_13500 [Streptomyces halstedii]|uniref:hypothetical protein n=1 Tax=Streptomyces halstedii TaxID=1944 RepID=UPI0038165D3E
MDSPCAQGRWLHWPNTADSHLLITQKTAVELSPAGKLWTTQATPARRGPLSHGADALQLVFGISIGIGIGIGEETAIRYADSARALLGDAAEGPKKKIDGEPASTMLGWRDAT